MSLQVASELGGLSAVVEAMSEEPLFFRAPRKVAHAATMAIAVNSLLQRAWVTGRTTVTDSRAAAAGAFFTFSAEAVASAAGALSADAAAAANVAASLNKHNASAAIASRGALVATPLFTSSWRQIAEATFETGADWTAIARRRVVPAWAADMVAFRVFGAPVTAEGAALPAPATADELLARIAASPTGLAQRLLAFTANALRLAAWQAVSNASLSLAVPRITPQPVSLVAGVDEAVAAGLVGQPGGVAAGALALAPAAVRYDKVTQAPVSYDSGDMRNAEYAAYPTGFIVVAVTPTDAGDSTAAAAAGGAGAGAGAAASASAPHVDELGWLTAAAPLEHAVRKDGFRTPVLPSFDKLVAAPNVIGTKSGGSPPGGAGGRSTSGGSGASTRV